MTEPVPDPNVEPLSGVRVLDLTRVVAGPHSTRMLAELGADVIKVEPPGGDQTRSSGALGGTSASGFVQLNAGKRLMCIDLSSDDGRQLIRDLVAHVDVLMENFRPGVMDGWQLGYDELATVNPGLIYVSISGYGQTGDWRERRAYAPYVHAEAGYLATVAQLRGAGVEHDPMSTADLVAAKDATIALLAALYRRRETGTGRRIDVALAHSILFANEFASALLTPGSKPPRSGSTPQTVFTTSDGVPFSAGNPVSSQVFDKFCRAFGCAELMDDPRFIDSGRRRTRRAELIDALQETLDRAAPFEEIERSLAAEGLAVGRVRTMVEVAEAPWAAERGAVATALDPSGREVRMPTVPWRFSRAVAAAPEAEAGALGRDNSSVLIELLNADSERLRDLHDHGVLRDAESSAELDGGPSGRAAGQS